MEAFAGRTDYFLKKGEMNLAWRTVKKMQWCLTEAYKRLDMTIVENKEGFQKGKRLLSFPKADVFIISPKCYLALSNYRQMIGRGKRT